MTSDPILSTLLYAMLLVGLSYAVDHVPIRQNARDFISLTFISYATVFAAIAACLVFLKILVG